MTDLRPSILEDLGLVAAIEWLALEFKSRHEVNCHVTAHEAQIALGEEASIALFRITQESLTNIAKHAKASMVEIVLTLQDKELLLLISDNGQGLKAGWQTKEGSYGLQGMRERALALSGELTVNSKANQGVQLLIRIPL
jgi:signal transduction histidine kinase